MTAERKREGSERWESERQRERQNVEKGGGRGRWKRSGEMGHEGFMPLAVVGGWIASRAA